MISQFYILPPRGDTIINRDFRGDIVKGTAEIFYRKIKFWSGDAPPVFPLDGITYMFLKRGGLYFVATAQQNVSPSYCLELLEQVSECRSNIFIKQPFVLMTMCSKHSDAGSSSCRWQKCLKILDEIIDFGYP